MVAPYAVRWQGVDGGTTGKNIEERSVFWYNREIYSAYKKFMTTKSTQSGNATFPTMPKILSPDAVYDMLMRDIEPELTSDNVDGLSKKYENEKPDQARRRAERYALAFDEYDKRLDIYIEKLNKAMAAYVRTAAKSLEATDRAIDKDNLRDLETQFSS